MSSPHLPALLSTPSVAEARRICSDPAQPLDTRLEALEDVFEAEVGDTPLLRARSLERRFGLTQLYLKFEGDNPTGTQKDRIAFAQVDDALRWGFAGVVFATCGNYGVSVAYAAQVVGMRAVAVIPTGYVAPRLPQIKALGAEIERLGLHYEDAVVAARALSAERELYDANPGGANERLQIRAYREIALEIYDELRDAPAAVALPVSNGTTLVGVARGFAALHRRGRTSHLPRMIAGSAYKKNPIVRSFQRGDGQYRDLHNHHPHESVVNEPLVGWQAIDGEGALGALLSTGGFAADISDARMRELARLIREEQGMFVQPAATAGLAALLALHQKAPLPPDRYVAVLTGRAE